MKKIIALLLACLMVMCLFAGCNNNTPSAEGGSVYYLNFKPEAEQAWLDLAATYTEQTGVEVKIVTAASGSYSDTLTAEMGKADAPTLFQCGNQQGLIDWDEYCLDLTDTKVVKEMTTDDFNLYNEAGELKAIGYCYECFGIIVNKALLAEAGYSIEDIKDFASLKAIAEDIHANAETLGFDAFTSSGLDSSSSWRFSGHLANMPLFYECRDNGVTEQPAELTGAYLENFKNIWDLYINNSATAPADLTSATGDQALEEFGKGKAVFYQNGSWEFANLCTDETKGYMLNAEDLTMIPIYCGVEGEEDAGLCSGTENCWAVNSKASKEDIQATLDFMYWVVTSDEGTQMMADNLGPIPFKSAKTPENSFFAAANEYTTAGNYVVTWAFNWTPNVDDWRAGVVSALAAYSAGTGEWTAVEEAFVNGWAYQYANQG
ncbi:MAG: carbohydrate ABC transporter substrate-binding protein [Ruminococcaceae bacterium]|nr:carbohydrate ABC transporter substrate-binding protein [Oscillospiraceae bacterium]